MGGRNTTINQTSTIIINNAKASNPPTPNFVTLLLTWANDLVPGNPLQITNDPDRDFPTLDTALDSIAVAHFFTKYGYTYANVNTDPTLWDQGSVFETLDDLVNCTQNSPADVTQYVDTTVFPNHSTAPDWALHGMRADLAAYAQGILAQPVIQGWKIAPYTRTYRARDGASSIKLDSMCVYTVIRALDGKNVPAKTLFMNFVGVYYGVSPTGHTSSVASSGGQV